MRGTILGSGIISGSDGKRYRFNLEDVKNLNGKTEQSLEQCEVDFEVDESQEKPIAKDIFIVKGSMKFNTEILSLNDNSIGSIKLKAYIGIVLSAMWFIPFVGWILSILGIVVFVFALIGLSEASQSKGLVFNYIISKVLSLAGYFITSIVAVSAFLMGGSSGGAIAGIGAGAIVGFLVALGSLYFAYKYYKQLTEITNEKLFFYSFIASVVATVLILVPVLGILLRLAAFVVEVVAWVRFQEIRKVG